MTAQLFETLNGQLVHKETFAQIYLEATVALNTLNTVFRLHVSHAKPLDDNEFWAMIDELNTEIRRTGKKPDYELAFERFCWEYAFRNENKIDKVVRFIKTYESKVAALYKPLNEVIEGYGDDGYGDILDSFPLFGREKYEKALKGEIKGDPYQGENYIKMKLTDAAFEKFGQTLKNQHTESKAYYDIEKDVKKRLGA